MSNNSNVQTMTIASIYEERDRMYSEGDHSLGTTSDQIDALTSSVKDLIKNEKLSFGSADWISVHDVERILNDFRYDTLRNWRSIVALFLPEILSLVTNGDRAVISLGRIGQERPALVILDRYDNGVYSLLDLESAEVIGVNDVQLAARVIAAGVEYL